MYRRLREFDAAVEDLLKALDMMTESQEDMVQQAQRQLLLTYNDFAVHCYTQGAYQESVLLLNKALKDEQQEKGLYINRGGEWGPARSPSPLKEGLGWAFEDSEGGRKRERQQLRASGPHGHTGGNVAFDCLRNIQKSGGGAEGRCAEGRRISAGAPDRPQVLTAITFRPCPLGRRSKLGWDSWALGSGTHSATAPRAPDCFFQLGNLIFAEADYQQALELNPQDEGANLRMGLLQEMMGFCQQKSKCAPAGGWGWGRGQTGGGAWRGGAWRGGAGLP